MGKKREGAPRNGERHGDEERKALEEGEDVAFKAPGRRRTSPAEKMARDELELGWSTEDAAEAGPRNRQDED